MGPISELWEPTSPTERRPDSSRSGPIAAEALALRYEAYCRYQVRELLALIPRQGIRSLYCAARAARSDAPPSITDPLAVLTDFVCRLIPLPPFPLWCEDVRRHPEAHLDEAWMEDARPDLRSPLTLDSRVESLLGASWRADLRVHHDGEGWRGHLAFRGEEEERVWSTADIFQERRVQSVRVRFREFDRATLEAFLRSVLP